MQDVGELVWRDRFYHGFENLAIFAQQQRLGGEKLGCLGAIAQPWYWKNVALKSPKHIFLKWLHNGQTLQKHTANLFAFILHLAANPGRYFFNILSGSRHQCPKGLSYEVPTSRY